MKIVQKIQLIVACCVITLLMASCFGSRPAYYFDKSVIDTSLRQSVRVPEPVIQKGDLLSITIFSDNPAATAIYNQAGSLSSAAIPTSGVSGGINTTSSGSGANSTYLVDANGQIRLHALGKISVEGMTRNELGDTITAKLDRLGVLSNPYCVIRFNNFKITVLGEVGNPGVFTLPTEKASILEALGLAGDFTDFSIKDSILLIRELNGVRTYRKIDLTDPAIFESPEFYLRQNDVLVVRALKNKPTDSDQMSMRYISLALAVISTAVLLYTVFQ
jgi:polysaccharide export outer membrane protein